MPEHQEAEGPRQSPKLVQKFPMTYRQNTEQVSSLGTSIYPPHSISSSYFSAEIIYLLDLLFNRSVRFGPHCLLVFLI